MIKPLEIVSQHRGSEKVEMALRHLPFTPYSTSQREYREMVIRKNERFRY